MPAMSTPEFLLDKRIVERNIAKGLLQRADAKAAIQSLPDVEANAEACVLEPEGAEGEATAEGEAAEPAAS